MRAPQTSANFTDSVQSLLARFRHASSMETTVTSPAPTAVMSAAPAEATRPSTQGHEVMRYDPMSQHQTRSQQRRFAAAEGGDLNERLNLITIEAAEHGLQRRFCKHYPERSILEYLQRPGEGVAPHEAVTAVLEDLADETAETASGLALVYRYMQVHEMWKTHPDRNIRSAEDFVECLDRAGYIRTGLVIGTAAQTAKRNSTRRIQACWGDHWFHEVPLSIRDERWRGPEDLSKNVLARIATTAEQGRSLEMAVRDWMQAIQRRNDVGARRELDIKGRVTPFLVLADVSIPDGTVGNGRQNDRNADGVPLYEPKEERLRVELIPRQPPSRSTVPEPDYAEATLTKMPKKRKRTSDTVADEGGAAVAKEDGWKKSGDGRWLTKRVRNQIIRKPVEEVGETRESLATSQDDEGEHHTLEEPRTATTPNPIPSTARLDSPPASTPHPSPATSSSKTCAGPAFANALRELTKSFAELNDPDYLATRFCDCCRSPVTAATYSILDEIRTNGSKLDNNQKHRFGTAIVPARQERQETPKRPRRWDTLFVTDGSETDESDPD
ncbi:hypothetical protein LTR78_010948 [Recurvomyces mirabilis]|uniref:Uncharacterized protein n=1 Tax=Recurvomyces mirabilis TaxID=574656 RepID=A0AAE0WGL8_9PEZI|nr:hypothetical protein LTR78_010948 [Recurvomyces mirabilis]KAK5149439.1 hypothetical protein LTS14_010932 [Recurvomyces mirabilis]